MGSMGWVQSDNNSRFYYYVKKALPGAAIFMHHSHAHGSICSYSLIPALIFSWPWCYYMNMYHDIETELLPFFLRDVLLQKLSGHLFVTARDFHISLNLMKGKLANGMSTHFDEKISVILHLMNIINDEQYDFLSDLNQFSDDQITGVLLDQKFAKKKDIYYARVYQLRRIAISTFALQRGKWIFTAGEPEPPLRETFEIPLDTILVEGARAIDHASVYASKWQSCIPVLFKEIPISSEIYFTEQERKFFTALQRQGRRTCKEIIVRLNMAPIGFWRSILAFHLMGIIEFEKGVELPDPSAEVAALMELNQRLRGYNGNITRLLGLPSQATTADIEKAKAELLVRFAPEHFISDAPPATRGIAHAVCKRLQQIAVGRKDEAELPPEPELPNKGERVIELESPPEPELLDKKEMVIELESPAKTELLNKKEMVIELESPVEPELLSEAEMIIEPKLPAESELQNEVELLIEPEVPAQWNVAPNWEVDVQLQAKPDMARKSDMEPEAPIEPPSREFVPAAAPPAANLAEGAHEKAWDFMLKSKRFYERREFDKAIPLLKYAIKLEPNQGDFHYLLGLCQSKLEIMHNEAEIHLKKAIELKSWSADPVYALGILYRSQGKMKVAERCFQRVKEISYEHTGASRGLVDLRRLRSGKKSKSPFGKK
jgi:hypothetical protein